MENLEFNNYNFEIKIADPKLFDPKKEAVEVILTTDSGREYYAGFITKDFINYMFEKNKRTGECSNGTYFTMPKMIIVEEISRKNIKKTIDDLISNFELKDYFSSMGLIKSFMQKRFYFQFISFNGGS